MSLISNTSSEHTHYLGISRKRKNFFDCKKRPKIKYKHLILMHAEVLSQFYSSIGLKIYEIILSPKTD